jgi:hypothetical protein
MRLRCFGRIEPRGDEVGVELWRYDPGLLGAVMPRFLGRVRTEETSTVIEGRFALASHVRVLLVMAAIALGALGAAFGNHRAWGVVGCLVSSVCVPGLAGGVFLLLRRQAERTTWRDITRAVRGEDA